MQGYCSIRIDGSITIISMELMHLSLDDFSYNATIANAWEIN